MNTQNKIGLFKLFITFLKIGLFTFGGGYAMLGMFRKELVEKYAWATEEELLDYYAISQCTPGVIAVNTASFIGYKMRGPLGAVFATLGVVFPSVVIITTIAIFLNNLMKYQAVNHFIAGLRVGVCAILINALYTFGKKAIKDRIGIIIAVCACVLSFVFDISPVWIVIGAAFIGIFVKKIKVK